MRLFSWLVYVSFIVRLWLLAFGVPVTNAATVWFIILAVACIIGDLYVWSQNRQKIVETMAKVLKAQVEQASKTSAQK
jgi:hypothetical protein